MSFIRKIRKPSGTYLVLVESYRKDGKVKQRVIKYLGKEIKGKPVRRVRTDKVSVKKVKRCCDVLVVDRLSRELGLPELLGEDYKNILLLVYSHLLDRVSIDKIEEWAGTTEIPEALSLDKVSSKKLYQALARLNEVKFSRVEEHILEHFMEYESENTTAILDVTDTYFEGKKASCKPRRGKDGKRRKLLQIGLAVTLENGFPVMHKTYSGNVSNMKIFKDMAVDLREKRLKSIIIDRGMYTLANLKDMIALEFKGIVGVRKTREFKKRFISSTSREQIYSRNNRVKLKNTKVYIRPFKFLDGSMILVYNPYLEVVKRELHYEKGGSDEDAKHLGYTLLFHNTGLSDEEAVKKYFEKDMVERSFKKLKGILNLRPVRVWLKEHTEAHVKICYLAYAVLSLLSYKVKGLDVSAEEAIEKLKTCHKVYLEDEESGFSWSSIVALEKVQEKILKKTGVVYKK